MSLLLYTVALSVIYLFCMFLTFCWMVYSRSILTPVDTSVHNLEKIRLVLHADARFEAKGALQIATVGNWTKKWNATIIRNFQPILEHCNTPIEFIPNIAYHKNCWANFTKQWKILKSGQEHTWTCIGSHHIKPHWITSTRQCRQRKWPEAYTPNIFMPFGDPIQSLSDHQSEQYIVRAQCRQFFAICVASAANRSILCYSEQNFARFHAYRIRYACASCAHIHSDIQTCTTPNHTIWCNADLCVLECIPGLRNWLP